MEEELDDDLGIERDLIEIAEKLKEHANESAGEKLSIELMDLENMKQTVKMEIENRIEHLTNEYQKWKTYNEDRDQFEEWLKTTEKELKTLSTTAINLDTPTKFQVGLPSFICFLSNNSDVSKQELKKVSNLKDN